MTDAQITGYNRLYEMHELFPTVWYATPGRAASVTKLLVFDDTGRLEASPQGSTFTGGKYRIEFGAATEISLTRQRPAWAVWLLMNAAMLILMLCSLFPIASMLLESLPIDMWLVGVSLGLFLLLVFIAANGFGLLVGYSQRWVLVEYKTKAGQAERAYFADASGLGWGGIFGGTKRLYETLASSNHHVA